MVFGFKTSRLLIEANWFFPESIVKSAFLEVRMPPTRRYSLTDYGIFLGASADLAVRDFMGQLTRLCLRFLRESVFSTALKVTFCVN